MSQALKHSHKYEGELQDPSAGAVTAWRHHFSVSRAESTSLGQTTRVGCCETGKPAFLSGIAKAGEGDGALPLKTENNMTF